MSEIGLIPDPNFGNDFLSGITEEYGQQIAREGIRVFNSMNNRDIILKKIEQIKFYKDTWDCSVFFTIYFKFSNPHSLEEINKTIVNSLSDYRKFDQKDCTFQIGNICCNILPEYSFVSNMDSFDSMDDDLFDDLSKDDAETIIPDVGAVTIFVASADEKQIPISTFMRIFTKMEDKMKEERLHLRKSGTCTYFRFNATINLEKMYEHLSNEIKKLDFKMYLDRIGQDELRLINTPEIEKLIATLK